MELIKTILSGAMGAALVTGLFGIWQWFLNRSAQKEDRAAEQKAIDCAARGEEIREL